MRLSRVSLMHTVSSIRQDPPRLRNSNRDLSCWFGLPGLTVPLLTRSPRPFFPHCCRHQLRSRSSNFFYH